MISEIPAGNNYDAWRLPQYTRETFQHLSPRERMAYLCQLAILAPSSHNSQPWRFSLDEHAQEIKIFLDRRAVLAASDVDGRQGVESIGCALEHLAIGAACLGYGAMITMYDVQNAAVRPLSNEKEKNPLIPIAHVSFSEAEKEKQTIDAVFHAIFTRKMIRAEFDPSRSIDKNILEELHAAIAGLPVALHVVKDPIRRQAIAEFQAQADGFVINSLSFSRELGAWLLPNDSSSGLGMPGIGFGLRDEQALRIHRGLLGKAPLEPEDGLRFSLAGKIGMEKSPAICFLTTPGDTVRDWIAAGRAMDRLFLLLESHGISVAVHAGIVEVPLINRMFAMTLGTAQKMMAVFRIGYVKKQEDALRPHSPRLAVGDVLIESSPQTSAY